MTEVFPIDLRKLFACEKHFELKNLWHENGDGWAHFTTLCFFLSIRLSFFWAKFPHNKNTQPEFFSETNFMILSVKMSHPIFECEPALCALCQAKINNFLKYFWIKLKITRLLKKCWVKKRLGRSIFVSIRQDFHPFRSLVCHFLVLWKYFAETVANELPLGH